jgi:Amt family ammonium transporter
MVINGVLAGLVAVTAGCNVVDGNSAIIIGAIAGVLVDIAVVLIDKIEIDDPVGAIAVHGVNGLFGTVAVGLFATENGLFFGGGSELLITQVIGVLAIGTFSFVVTFVVMKIMKKTIGIRVTKEEEAAGIDAVTYGVEAYSTFE